MTLPLDDIATFLGNIPADEYAVRRRIKACRNAASYKLTRTECGDSLQLLWMATTTASVWIYRPATVAALHEVADHLEVLLMASTTAETLEALQ